MKTSGLTGLLVLVLATAAAANQAQWTITGPTEVRQGDPVTWQAFVAVTGANQGLAGYAFNVAVGTGTGPTAGADGQWGTADDENIVDVSLSSAAWVASFKVQGSPAPGAGTVKDDGLAGGPGMGTVPSAGNNALKSGELLQVGTGYLTWTPFSPPGQGQTAGVGLASRKSALLMNPAGEYVIHSGTIPTSGLAAGTYMVRLIPLRTRVLRPGQDLSQTQPGFLMMAADAVGSSFEFTVRTGIPADFDKDGDVDLEDFTAFTHCFNGPNRAYASTGCENADFDADADVDLEDFTTFTHCFNGPNRTPACN